MISKINLIREINRFPDDTNFCAYEGEDSCIVAKDKNTNKELGYILATSNVEPEFETKAVIHD